MTRTLRGRASFLTLAPVVWLATAPLSAEFIQPHIQTVPVDRLAQNIERQLKDKPEDILLRLNLARLYAMAYALKTTELKATSRNANLTPWFGHLPPAIPETVKKAPSQEHQKRAEADLTRAMGLYREVIARAPDNFIAHLGLGWSLEQASQEAEAIAEYRKVVELGFPAERKQEYIIEGQKLATIEAIQQLKTLLDPVRDAQELAVLQEKASELGRLGRAITPIVIPLGDTRHVPPLAADVHVLFDADGSGLLRRWTWIGKDAGWLVYDADGRGEITSALQWFGSVTFWLFWNNGYDPLAALDDDGDRELRGNELRNLAIWRDANQNGISEKGEVRSLAAHGIAALSCSYERGDGVSVAAHSPRGVVLGDGSTRPTFDVILRTAGRPVTLTAPLH
jgi:tetratricopeptide (TPR) repeat protein